MGDAIRYLKREESSVEQELLYWVWLSSLDISPKARFSVIRTFVNAEAAFRSAVGSFGGVQGISEKEAELLEKRDLSSSAAVLAECRMQNIRLIPYTSPEYPDRLRHISCPPAVLFVQGVLPDIDSLPVLAVIGTRKASPYGEKMARIIASEIAEGGGTVLTLLNSGVDEAAARGALMADRPCIAVLGTPHERLRSSLREDFRHHGALVSEYPPKRRTARHFFRERNRIAAGLSVGVVVVEAPERSGTRLFVQEAAEQGKDIFAVPGNADAENSAGTLTLLKEGAKLVTNGSGVLVEYECLFPALLRKKNPDPAGLAEKPPGSAPELEQGDTSGIPGTPERTEERPRRDTPQNLKAQLTGLTEEQLRILGAISRDSSHIDDIAEETELSTSKVLAQLTFLEIKGYVRRETGRRFSLNTIRTEK